MKILHVSTRLILGGSQENTVLSCEGQARAGHEVHLAFGPIFGPEGSLLERVRAFATADGRRIITHEVPDLCRELSPLRDRRAMGQLRRLIAHVGPDVVHTHSSKAGVLGRGAAWAQRAAARGAGRRLGVVHTIHGPPFMPVEGGPVARLRRRAGNALYTLAERWAARRCHVIVAVADAMTGQYLARGIGRPEQYATVRSGMEVGEYLTPRAGEGRDEVRAALGLGPGDFVVGTVARLAEHKGHDDLLTALGPALSRARSNWRLLWVGDGWLRQRLVARVRGMGLEGRVVLTGLVPPERVPGLVRAMDVLAHPSLREGLPRTVPQALLCGVAPVAYDVDGTGEVCIDALADPARGTGRLVPAGDAAALGRAVEWLEADAARRAALAARGREVCRERFSVAAMLRGLDAAYARALELAGEGRS